MKVHPSNIIIYIFLTKKTEEKKEENSAENMGSNQEKGKKVTLFLVLSIERSQNNKHNTQTGLPL